VLFQEAIDVAERAGDRDGRFSGREALSCVNLYLAEYDTTLRLCDEALAISGDDPSVGLSIAAFGAGFVHVNKGWALTDLGRYEEAADAFRRGTEGLRRLDASEPVSWTDGFIARLLSRMGDVRGALAAAGRSVASAEEVGSFIALVNAYAHHGMALLLDGEFAAAEERLEVALEIARKNRVWITLEGDFMALLAEAKLGLGNGDGAKETVDRAVESTRRTDTPPFELHARLVCARVLRTLGGATARADIEGELDQAEQLLHSTGALSYEPEILEERGALASWLGDAVRGEQLRAEAVALYRKLGATGHAERLAS
jgi:tetratricopeptide (TPR) repeat protein